MHIRTAAVIGSGTMGAGIAHVLARGGLEVRLVDVSSDVLQRALGRIAQDLGRQVEKERITEEEKRVALERIVPVTGREPGVEGVQLVIEAVPEHEALKHEIFRDLDASAPREAILSSNTSSISITGLAAQTSRPEKVVGMHFMNPAPVMKLVEVVRGLATDDATVESVMDLAKTLGKQPVEVSDFPGFVSNRVLMPMINEAVFVLMEGVADEEGVDTVMKLGMNHPMGPLELADLIGLDTCLSILEVLHRELGEDRYRPCPLLRKYVAAGRLGRKSGRGFYVYEER